VFRKLCKIAFLANRAAAAIQQMPMDVTGDLLLQLSPLHPSDCQTLFRGKCICIAYFAAHYHGAQFISKTINNA